MSGRPPALSEPRRRLFVCTPSHSLQGGVERILESLARWLPREGWDVRLGLAWGARFHSPDRFRAAFPSITTVDLDARSGTAYARRASLRRALIEWDPHVVLSARIFDAYPVCAELKKSGSSLRFAVTLQGYEPEYFRDLRDYAPWVDLCVTSGALIARAAERFTSMPSDAVRSIPGGVASPKRLVEHDDNRPLRIGYAGRVEQLQKRILDLPAMAAELARRGVEIEIVVAGDGSALGEVRRLLPSAHYPGWLSTEELYDRIYPELDVFVHFAEWEGVTIAPREAMAHGVVPVVSQFVGLAEENQFLDHINALTFPVGDIAAASSCVERLYRDRTLLRALSASARGSQTGIRSEEGAARAWSEAFGAALDASPRLGDTLPIAPADSGVLSRLGVPPVIAELFRRRRARLAANLGAEWPHWSGVPDPPLFERLRVLAGGADRPQQRE